MAIKAKELLNVVATTQSSDNQAANQYGSFQVEADTVQDSDYEIHLGLYKRQQNAHNLRAARANVETASIKADTAQLRTKIAGVGRDKAELTLSHRTTELEGTRELYKQQERDLQSKVNIATIKANVTEYKEGQLRKVAANKGVDPAKYVLPTIKVSTK